MKNNSIKIFLAILYCSSMSTGLLCMQPDTYTIRRKNDIDQKLNFLFAEQEQEQSKYFQAAAATLGRSNLTNKEGRMNLDMMRAHSIGWEMQMIQRAGGTLEGFLANGASIDVAAQAVQNSLDAMSGTEKPSRKALRNIFVVPSFSH